MLCLLEFRGTIPQKGNPFSMGEEEGGNYTTEPWCIMAEISALEQAMQ